MPMHPLPEGYRIRSATIADAAVIAHHRTAMFDEMKALAPEHLHEFETESERWQRGVLEDDSYFGWLIEHEARVVAGGGLLVSPMGPVPGIHRTDRNAHIVNVYSEPEHRRKGLARALLTAMLDWCERESIPDVTLTASEEGYPLYVSLGFARSMHMRWQKLK